MTELNNENQNQDSSRENNGINNQNQNNKVPEYSFWAEQVPSNSNSYYNQGPNPYQGTNINQGSNINQGPNIYQGPNMNQGPNMYQGPNSWQYNNVPYNNPTYTNQVNNVPVKTKKKHGGKALKFIAKAICFGVIAAASFIGIMTLSDIYLPSSIGIFTAVDMVSSESTYEIKYTDSVTVKTADRSAITKITDSTIPAIVSINCTATTTTSDWFGQQYDQDYESSGSGIIVGKNQDELLIATNNHVVEGATEIKVTFTDGTQAVAEIKGTDATADLAVVTVDVSTLKEDTLNVIAVAKLGDSNAVKVGEMSIAIGNALGYGQSVTVGYISAKDREVEVSDGYTSKTMTFLQTDAAINPGNSGGALINMEGEVIGINTVKYASDEVEGMGYAIPISAATPVINELMSREVLSESEQGYLGIYGEDVTGELATYYSMPVGVYVHEVTEGGAAEKAGLKMDDIITKVNDVEITSMTQLKDKVNSLRVGTKVEITYMRNSDGEYKEATVTVTLGQNPQLSNNTK